MAIFAGKNFGYNGCNEGTLTFNRLFAGESAFLGFYDPREEKIMKKKLVSVILAGAMALCLAGCGGNTTTDTENGSSSLGDLVNSAIDDAVNNAVDEANSALTDAADQVSDVVDDVNAGLEEATGAASEGVMSYEEYAAADIDSEVTIECYVQAHQSWWDNKVSVYAQDEEGGYFLYNLACSEEDAAKLTEGTKIRVTGYKTMWPEVNGEVELAEGATFEFVDGDTFVAEPKDVTELVGTDDLVNYMNQKVSFKDMTVEAVSYKNGEPGDDIYVTLSKDGTNVEFCLEYYLNGDDEDLYNTVGNLEAGQTVDVEGFLYWYEGPDAHITGIGVKN